MRRCHGRNAEVGGGARTEQGRPGWRCWGAPRGSSGWVGTPFTPGLPHHPPPPTAAASLRPRVDASPSVRLGASYGSLAITGRRLLRRRPRSGADGGTITNGQSYDLFSFASAVGDFVALAVEDRALASLGGGKWADGPPGTRSRAGRLVFVLPGEDARRSAANRCRVAICALFACIAAPLLEYSLHSRLDVFPGTPV